MLLSNLVMMDPATAQNSSSSRYSVTLDDFDSGRFIRINRQPALSQQSDSVAQFGRGAPTPSAPASPTSGATSSPMPTSVATPSTTTTVIPRPAPTRSSVVQDDQPPQPNWSLNRTEGEVLEVSPAPGAPQRPTAPSPQPISKPWWEP